MNEQKLKKELIDDPRVITRYAIKAGDVIERWEPVYVPTSGGFQRFEMDKTGLMECRGRRIAFENEIDLAGRWSDENGMLVHVEHGGCDDAPGFSGWKVLLLVARANDD